MFNFPLIRKELIDRNDVLKLSIEFAVMIIGYCDVLEDEKKFILANQLLKCGTAIELILWKHKMQNAGLTLPIK